MNEPNAIHWSWSPLRHISYVLAGCYFFVLVACEGGLRRKAPPPRCYAVVAEISSKASSKQVEQITDRLVAIDGKNPYPHASTESVELINGATVIRITRMCDAVSDGQSPTMVIRNVRSQIANDGHENLVILKLFE